MMHNQKLAVVVPIKNIKYSKSRLSPTLHSEQRQNLAVEMLRHVLSIVAQENYVDKSYVITPDHVITNFVAENFPNVQVISSPADLNRAAAISSQLLLKAGYSSMFFLLGDLPFLTTLELQTAIRSAQEHAVVLLPDKRRKGTNGIILTPPNCMPTCFGENSLAAHIALARENKQDPYVLEIFGFAHDIDLPEDLALLRVQETQNAYPLQTGSSA